MVLLDQRITAFDREFSAQLRTDEAARRSIPGIGALGFKNLLVVQARWPDSRPVFWKPAQKVGLDAVVFMRTTTRGCQGYAEGRILDADRSVRSHKPLRPGAGHTFFEPAEN